ncbi:hypothetical protein NJB14197_46750 [Mycobacterium montefiorense]|uniref:Uncharacterized protein n=2 Tax=Mycobacterium montefiorense TaxID=154654 RepID=A0AA37UUG2_9MYCO|nr:hypothetical protein [Mycobacterium montefiorense]GBG40273.1 hypothetical protein MmonteBS_46450 [Mycobacterium montefiorense]GKU35202.1 hypothetical protein NJB14191_25480 [Mycobacterium montefiorense]GKU40156.1 hypothetical protein NJB14192_21430 [Mycobacterium montefiorense]GKU46095.1 hypothetical protein NJB14194_27150 [Mycobacterium montefiorense]GKU52967.1 hypothetical protein NJB14195_42080 [Mycobacterium montefiorense]
MQNFDFSSGQRVTGPSCRGRSSYGVAGVGKAIAMVLIAPIMLMGAAYAHAESGLDGYARCVGGDTKPPPPGVSAEVWFPSVHVITNDFDSGIPSAQIIQILVGMGVKPSDAATRVQCFLANQPRGEGH